MRFSLGAAIAASLGDPEAGGASLLPREKYPSQEGRKEEETTKGQQKQKRNINNKIRNWKEGTKKAGRKEWKGEMKEGRKEGRKEGGKQSTNH